MPEIRQSDNQDWISINTLASISNGTRIKIQNRANSRNILKENATKPLQGDSVGEIITTLEDREPSKEIVAGSGEVWVRAENYGSPVLLYIQEL